MSKELDFVKNDQGYIYGESSDGSCVMLHHSNGILWATEGDSFEDLSPNDAEEISDEEFESVLGELDNVQMVEE